MHATGDSLHGGRRNPIRAPRRAAGVAEHEVLALPSTKVEKEVVWGQGGG